MENLGYHINEGEWEYPYLSPFYIPAEELEIASALLLQGNPRSLGRKKLAVVNVGLHQQKI